jgi:hypothetical protein
MITRFAFSKYGPIAYVKTQQSHSLRGRFTKMMNHEAQKGIIEERWTNMDWLCSRFVECGNLLRRNPEAN